MPECHQVTNAQGEKAFASASNENCRDKTWEKCDLVDKVTDEHLLCHWRRSVQSEELH